MSTTSYVLLTIAAIIVIFCFVVARQPDDFHVTRTMTMNAAPKTIFDNVNDLHKWKAWSPWEKLDPNAKGSYEGPQSGEGAIMRWDGNNNVGAGSMKIIESQPPKLIKFQLDFLRPMEGTNFAEFAFTPQGKQTLVSWTMYGKTTFISKAVGLIMNCEKMVGEQFDAGLNNLKAVVEHMPAPAP